MIAKMALAPAVHSVREATLVHVAARDAARAARLGPDRASSDYRAVIDDPNVDVVYIALTNEVHIEWTLEALAAGKHVLCEKPLGMNAAEVAIMNAAAAQHDRLLIEAMWYRWHPRTARAKALVESGWLGEVTKIESSFTFPGVAEGNYRLEPARGGGALYDIGCYVVDAALWAAGDTEVTVNRVERDLTESGVDATTVTHLSIGGAETTLTASINQPERQTLRIEGTDAALIVGDGTDTFTSLNAPSTLTLQGSINKVEAFAPCDPYALMVSEMCLAIREGSAALRDPIDALANAAVLDSIFAN